MPFGLSEAPKAFQRMVDLMLEGLKWTACLPYLDDVIIYRPDYMENIRRLSKVLELVKESNLGRYSELGLSLNPD